MAFMNGIASNAVLGSEVRDVMFAAHLGWYPFVGEHGVYYHHNGMLTTAKVGGERTCTGVMHLVDGYDLVLLVNSPVVDIIRVMAGAFDATRPT